MPERPTMFMGRRNKLIHNTIRNNLSLLCCDVTRLFGGLGVFRASSWVFVGSSHDRSSCALAVFCAFNWNVTIFKMCSHPWPQHAQAQDGFEVFCFVMICKGRSDAPLGQHVLPWPEAASGIFHCFKCSACAQNVRLRGICEGTCVLFWETMLEFEGEAMLEMFGGIIF